MAVDFLYQLEVPGDTSPEHLAVMCANLEYRWGGESRGLEGTGECMWRGAESCGLQVVCINGDVFRLLVQYAAQV